MAAPVIDIDDPVTGADGARKQTVRETNAEVPLELTLMFRDEMQDFQQASALSRISKGEIRTSTIEVPAVVDVASAQSELRQLHRQMATGREKMAFRSGWSDIGLTPGDLVRPFAGETKLWRVHKISDGDSRLVEVESFVSGGKVAARSKLPGSSGTALQVSGVPWSAFMDLPALPQSPAPSGLRVAAWAKPWTPMMALSSPDTAVFSERIVLTRPAVAGSLTAPLPSGRPGRWDRSNVIEVALFSGSLASAGDLLILGGANAAAIKAGNGQWEIIQFATASEIAAGVWRLEGLLRGQLGTEDCARTGADAGADFILLDGAVAFAGLTGEESGLQLNWKIGPQGKDFTDRYFDTATVGPATRYAKSYAPAHVKSRSLANGDMALSWVRRSRAEGDRWDAAEIPLPEGVEQYRIRIFDAASLLKRETAVSANSWTYTKAMQTADFGSGSQMATAEICQIGEDGLAGIAAQIRMAID